MNIPITGLGCISAAGKNLPETLQSFKDGLRQAGVVSLFPTNLQYPVFEVKKFIPEPGKNRMRTMDLALTATFEAMSMAGYKAGFAGLRVGVCLGTTVASQLNDLEFYRTYKQSGEAPMKAIDRYLQGNLSEAVAREVKANGPCCTVVNACSSGTDAIGVASSWLRAGLCDVVIAGGADELNMVPYCGFASLGIVSKNLCAPFDRDRMGLNLGEGAGILILETEQTSRSRGDGQKLSLAGYASCADAYHLTAPHPEGHGLENALREAMNEAGITPGEVSFVNAHGTATHDNDLVEGKILSRFFGPKIKILSTKGYTGHTLGAAGGMEAGFSAAALNEGWIPASAGFLHQDEEIPLTPVTETSAIHGQYAVSTSLGFGGSNAVIVLKRKKS
ncbi:MAG: beta-ketoacyl-[acyl-carrier-protein] synthase family protein [Elusimicrobiota bacterium]